MRARGELEEVMGVESARGEVGSVASMASWPLAARRVIGRCLAAARLDG